MDNNSMLARVLKTHKRVSYITGQILLQEAYEQSWGIHDHITQAQREADASSFEGHRPLSLIAVKPAEDCGGTQTFQALARFFEEFDMQQRFGISFLEYLELPRHEAQILRDVAEAAAKRRSPPVAKLPDEDKK